MKKSRKQNNNRLIGLADIACDTSFSVTSSLSYPSNISFKSPLLLGQHTPDEPYDYDVYADDNIVRMHYFSAAPLPSPSPASQKTLTTTSTTITPLMNRNHDTSQPAQLHHCLDLDNDVESSTDESDSDTEGKGLPPPLPALPSYKLVFSRKGNCMRTLVAMAYGLKDDSGNMIADYENDPLFCATAKN